MKYLEDKLAWSSTLKPGDKVEDEYCGIQEIARIENRYEYREPNWFPILRALNGFSLEFIRNIFSKKVLVDRSLHFVSGNIGSAINDCNAIEE